MQNLAHELSNADQADGESKYKELAGSLVKPFILKSKDKDVKAHAACCLADILRIFAPEAPYSEEELKVRWQWFNLLSPSSNKHLRRFPLNVRAVSAKIKLPKKYLQHCHILRTDKKNLSLLLLPS